MHTPIDNFENESACMMVYAIFFMAVKFFVYIGHAFLYSDRQFRGVAQSG